VYGGRLILRAIQFLVRSIGYGRTRLLLVGSGEQAEALEEGLLNRSDASVNFIKRIDLESPEAMTRAINKYSVDEVILAPKGASDNQLFEYVLTAQNNNVICHMIPNVFEIQSSNVLFQTIAGTPILTFRQTPLDGWGRIVKRIIDTLVAGIAIILLSPLILIIMLLIKITDPGPVLYGHKRLSRGGKKIKIYKFRSMMAKYSVGPGFNKKTEIEIFQELGRPDLVEEFKRDQKVKDDPRVTKIGKFLRKSSLDELPQLFNVLRGELSLVGPRPIVADELKRYGRWGSYLLSIKPGMTGLWQVSGRNDVSYEERVKIDTHYVQHWSLWQDVVILVKTALIVVGGKSGY
jgi:exopolysaccharide biosynthesis polyprenyl glycosylphosphotransferase